MSSLTDMLTAAKNIVTAVNAMTQSYIGVQGSQNLADISTATLIKQGPGRVASVSVTTAGSTAGAIYDASLSTSTSNLIWSIPNTVEITVVNFPLRFGLVVVPGTDQVVTVSYS